MKLLVVSQHFWPENFRINELAFALGSRGVTVEVMTGKPNYPGGKIFKGYRAWGFAQESHQNVLIHRIPLLPRGTGVLRLTLNYLSFVFSGIVFGSWLVRRRKFDAIFVFASSPILQAIPAIFIGRIKKCPVLIWVQDLWPESLSATGYLTHPGTLRLVSHIVRWIYQSVDLLLVQSKAFIPRVKLFAGKTPVVYYPNSFLQSHTDTTMQSVTCKGFDCAFPVLFAGNLGNAQAVGVVLEAATYLREDKDICFLMIGDGSRRDWMMKQAVDRNLNNLVFPGSFPVEVMPTLMSQAAVLLVTLADKEIFRLTIPSKVQAYMAAGRPIIACLNGAGADVVNEAKAGMTVAAEDGAALARAVRAMRDLPACERAIMGANGRLYYEENFSHDKLVTKLIQYLDHAVNYFRKIRT
jgi:glycosyltransferase involved in cell wall biosynthesis